ncbi:peptidase M23 [Actinomyces sp. oral taxon 414]|nr:peptidase M23 [Actinomyces sp. oral taxon 414]
MCTCPLSPAPASAAAVVLPAAGGPSAAVVLLAGAAPPAGAAADGRTPRSDYTWPTGGPAAVLEDFDPPAVVWGSGHRGVDLALSAGSPVLAAGAGTVVFAGMVAGRPVVSIDHSDGIRTTYEPVEACVSAGDAVGRGQVIGTLVAGHRSDGVDALHWGARTGPKTYVNPLRLLRPAVIRLKPVQ